MHNHPAHPKIKVQINQERSKKTHPQQVFTNSKIKFKKTIIPVTQNHLRKQQNPSILLRFTNLKYSLKLPDQFKETRKKQRKQYSKLMSYPMRPNAS
jgi:hypothetical protein